MRALSNAIIVVAVLAAIVTLVITGHPEAAENLVAGIVAVVLFVLLFGVL